MADRENPVSPSGRISPDAWQEELQLKLANLPDSPGVYIMKNAVGKVIYVGKAKVLKNRVRSYFQNTDKTVKTELLVSHIRALDYIITKTEAEALMVENTLIKKHKPQYNILLKDDKSYPYIRITMQEAFPRIEFTRRIARDGARYFGSYVKAAAVRESIDFIRRMFPIRTCRRDIREGDEQRPCLYYHLGLCSGPCCGAVPSEAYREMARSACAFLEGKSEPVLREMERQMAELAEEMKFEQAARVRDRIRSLREIQQKQTVVSTGLENRDIVALHGDEWHFGASVLSIRNGRLAGKRSFTLFGKGSHEPGEVLETFLVQYYADGNDLPEELILMLEPASPDALSEWLRQTAGRRVRMTVPKRGTKMELMDMALRNAQEELEQSRRSESAVHAEHGPALALLAERLGLPGAPAIIEAYDISNTGSSEIVASMVVFVEGAAETSRYRRFKMKNVRSQDDYASMQEAISRRMRRYREGSSDDAFGFLPDLILADGAEGHVGAVREVLASMEIEVPVWGMAKDDRHRSHRLVDGEREVLLADEPELLRLIAAIQNEAHRFAITYNRNLRAKRQVKSALDDIPGVGPNRRKALLRAFGSVSGIRAATVEQVAEVPGIGPQLAAVVKNALAAGPGGR